MRCGRRQAHHSRHSQSTFREPRNIGSWSHTHNFGAGSGAAPAIAPSHARIRPSVLDFCAPAEPAFLQPLALSLRLTLADNIHLPNMSGSGGIAPSFEHFEQLGIGFRCTRRGGAIVDTTSGPFCRGLSDTIFSARRRILRQCHRIWLVNSLPE